MCENRQQLESKPGRPLTIRAIALGGVLMSLVGAAAIAALLYFYGGGTDRDRAGLDVVRTAGTLVVGTGGAIALLLTARRQRSTELTLEHQRKVAVATERDAAEQRITQLYTQAVDQLGSDKAPVRLGGLHALERLAQNNPDQRQTIVDVICAYLRMPYTPPGDQPPADDTSSKTHMRYEHRRQELQVRLTAQRILTAHVKPNQPALFWGPDIDLDLTEAYLHRLGFANCQIRKALFAGAQFHAWAEFSGARFSGYAGFRSARFTGDASFAQATFCYTADFIEARFEKPPPLESVSFDGARFEGRTSFAGTWFASYASVRGARARPHDGGVFDQLWPKSWTTRSAATDTREEPDWVYLVGPGSV